MQRRTREVGQAAQILGWTKGWTQSVGVEQKQLFGQKGENRPLQHSTVATLQNNGEITIDGLVGIEDKGTRPYEVHHCGQVLVFQIGWIIGQTPTVSI